MPEHQELQEMRADQDPLASLDQPVPLAKMESPDLVENLESQEKSRKCLAPWDPLDLLARLDLLVLLDQRESKASRGRVETQERREILDLPDLMETPERTEMSDLPERRELEETARIVRRRGLLLVIDKCGLYMLCVSIVE